MSLPSRAPRSLSAPGKVFLLGEYAVLAGLPALVAAVGPRFKMRVREGGGHPFHAESPAGRLLAWARAQGLPELGFDFADPGTGGFGASTAQFAMVYMAYAQLADWPRDRTRVWSRYREITGGAGHPPSGADLVAQWEGGVAFFDPSDRHYLDLFAIFDWSNLLVFSAAHQRKIATHEHLAQLGQVPNLEDVLIKGIGAVREGETREFGLALDEYSAILRSAGLEHEATTADLAAIRDVPGVIGAKGAGALQADAILVLTEPSARGAVIEAAKKRGLILTSDGLTCEMGVTCQMNGS